VTSIRSAFGRRSAALRCLSTQLTIAEQSWRCARQL